MAYVYRHIRLDKNEPFYIGISKSDDNYKRATKTHGRNKLWQNIINKTGYEIEILKDSISFSEAIVTEVEFIKLYGRIDLGTGTLSNHTSGGEGIKDISEDLRRKLSLSHIGYKPTEETRKKLSAASKLKGISKETREKMAAKLRGRKQPEWQRKILSEAAKGKKTIWNYKPIYQFNFDGILIGEFENMKIASEVLKVQQSNIRKVIKNERLHTGGFLFIDKNDDFDLIQKEINIKCQHIKNNKSAILGKNGTKSVLNIETGIEYKSIRDAAKNDNIPEWHIWKYLRKNIKYNFTCYKN